MGSIDFECSRTQFLHGIYDCVIRSGYQYETKPLFTELHHGNLKFNDERLLYSSKGIVTGITLENYFIKREQRHPLYWGLQSFRESDGTSANPVLELEKYDAIIGKLAKTLELDHGIGSDLSLTEVKYGWFAWICFPFTSTTIDLEAPETQSLLIEKMAETTNRAIGALKAYLDAWHKVIATL